ncbi:hypothetical protein V1478_018154 [Vespula squamosa]|uniref:Uncharacterized protein n=1 Tax=Vespula squamosa TaxID=30214 RepID=A0ABD1ZW96_VESSQ
MSRDFVSLFSDNSFVTESRRKKDISKSLDLCGCTSCFGNETLLKKVYGRCDALLDKSKYRREKLSMRRSESKEPSRISRFLPQERRSVHLPA